MSLMRSLSGSDAVSALEAERLYLRFPDYGDYEAWSALRRESRPYLEPWEPTWPPDDLERPAFRRRIRRYHREVKDEIAYPFFVIRATDHALLGAATLSYIRRGVSQACCLGYWLGQPHWGQGYMSEAVSRLAAFVFDDLRMHRIEAATVTTNAASQAVLRRCGFQEEGLARRYLKINGRWQDHTLFALLADDPRADGQAPASKDMT